MQVCMYIYAHSYIYIFLSFAHWESLGAVTPQQQINTPSAQILVSKYCSLPKGIRAHWENI